MQQGTQSLLCCLCPSCAHPAWGQPCPALTATRELLKIFWALGDHQALWSCTAIPQNKGRRQEQGEDKGDLHSPITPAQLCLNLTAAAAEPPRGTWQGRVSPLSHTECPTEPSCSDPHPSGTGMSPWVELPELWLC